MTEIHLPDVCFKRRNRLATLTAAAVIAVVLSTATVIGQVSQPDPPPNDNFTNALEVSGSAFQLAADLGAATRETFEPYSKFGRGQTAWWRWTAPEGGIYEWNSTVSSNLVAVNVYQEDGFGGLIPLVATYPRPSGTILVPDKTGSFQAHRTQLYILRLDLTDNYNLSFGFFFPGPIVSKPVAVDFSKSQVVPPANDSFTNRIALSGSNVVFTADLAAATSEPNEPQISTDVLHRTLWWTWDAPDYGTAVIRAHDTNGAPVVGIYTRGVLRELDLIASSATEFGNACYRDPVARDSVSWDTTPGTHYEIQVDRFPSFLASGPSALELTFMPAPANDTPAGALVIGGVEASLVVSNIAATLRPNEFRIPGQSGSNSVWFRWTAPSKGILQVTRFEPIHYDEPSSEQTFTTGVDSTWEGPPCFEAFADLHPLPPFVPVFGLFAEDHFQTNEPSGPTSLLTYGTNSLIAELFGGRDYWIELDGDQGSSGVTPLNLLLIPPPANDDFSNRVALPSESLRVTGRTFAATREVADPIYVENGSVLQRSVWWEWHAPSAGRWTLFVVKGWMENKFVIYRGNTATAASEIKSTEYEPVIFDCQAGETFQIGAFARAGFGGNVKFTLTPVESPTPRIQGFLDFWDRGYRSLTIQLPDNSGLPYVVEESSDLSSWTPVSTNANAWSHFLEIRTDLGKSQDFLRTRLLGTNAP